MATVIDSLVVTLGLDAEKFKKGQGEAREELNKTKSSSARTAKEMQADGKRAAEFFSGIKTEAMSLIGVLLGGRGLKAFAYDATNSLAALGRAAKDIGVGARDLAAFQIMIEHNGGSAAAATASLRGYAAAMEEFRVSGTASAAFPAINAIGIDPNSSPIAAFMKFMGWAQEHEGTDQGRLLINNFGHRLGFDQGTIDAAIQMGTLAKAQAELARGYSLAPTDGQIKSVTEMQQAVVGLGQAAEKAGNNLLAKLAPGIEKVADDLSHWITHNPNGAEAIGAFATALTLLGAVRISASVMGLTGVVSAMDSIVAMVMRLAPWLLPLSLSGDTQNDPEANRPYDSVTNPNLFDSTGLFGRWWYNHAPSWLQPGIPSDVEAEVRHQAILRGLDPDHMVALARQEGGGYSNTSPAGAYGPMQLMPSTYAKYGGGPGQPWQKNVAGGMDYYFYLLRLFNGNYAAADAAYNAGPTNPGVRHFAETGDPSGLPAETQKYIHSIDGVPSRPSAPAMMPPMPLAKPPPPSTSQKLLQVGSITIHTQATDARGIARDLGGALVDQANRGLA